MPELKLSGLIRSPTIIHLIGRRHTSPPNNMSYTFQGATQLNKDLNTWNVKKVAKKVASMIAIINDAANFDQPPNSWNVVR